MMNTYKKINDLKDFRIELHKILFDTSKNELNAQYNIDLFISCIKQAIEFKHKEITINNINNNYNDSRIDILFTHHKIDIDVLKNDIAAGYINFLMQINNILNTNLTNTSKEIYNEIISNPSFALLLFTTTVIAVEPNECTCILFI